jgi:hypothetical protein
MALRMFSIQYVRALGSRDIAKAIHDVSIEVHHEMKEVRAKFARGEA